MTPSSAPHPHPPGPHVAQTLAETRQALQCASLARPVEAITPVQSRSKPNGFAQTVHHNELTVREPGRHHVKAVGTQVDRGQHIGNARETSAQANLRR